MSGPLRVTTVTSKSGLYSHLLTNNPLTGQPWTAADLDNGVFSATRPPYGYTGPDYVIVEDDDRYVVVPIEEEPPMSTKLSRAAYERIVSEDVVWLDRQEDCPESDHIRQVVKDSIRLYYDVDFDLPRFYDVLREKLADELKYTDGSVLQQTMTSLDKAFARACVAVGPPGTAT